MCQGAPRRTNLPPADKAELGSVHEQLDKTASSLSHRLARLLAALQESAPTAASALAPIPYGRRLLYSLLGGAVFVLLTTLLVVMDPSHAPLAGGMVTFLVRDVGLAAGCGLLASCIPSGTLRASFLYGLTMPLALALVVVTVAH